jgi:hypothetical protein
MTGLPSKRSEYENKVARKAAVDSVRRAVFNVEATDAELLAVVERVRNGAPLVMGELYPVEIAVREALDNVLPEWFLTDGLRKITKVRIPGAVILSDSMKLGEETLKALVGCIYVAEGRALIFHSDKFYFCDVAKLDWEALAGEHNLNCIEAMRGLLLKRGLSRRSAEEMMDSLMVQARGLSLDYEDETKSEFDSDEGDTFFPENWLEELRNRMAWEEWLRYASKEEFLQQLEHDPSVFSWLGEFVEWLKDPSSIIDSEMAARVLEVMEEILDESANFEEAADFNGDQVS